MMRINRKGRKSQLLLLVLLLQVKSRQRSFLRNKLKRKINKLWIQHNIMLDSYNMKLLRKKVKDHRDVHQHWQHKEILKLLKKLLRIFQVLIHLNSFIMLNYHRFGEQIHQAQEGRNLLI